jgi:hypothetical protein
MTEPLNYFFGIIEDAKVIVDHLYNCSKEDLKPAAIEK